MGIITKIQWCHHTFNPWIGCTKVSAGCMNCYAEALMDKRWGKVNWGKGNPRQKTSVSNWLQPIKWNRAAEEAGERRRVFCSSLADVFDEEVPRKWREDLAKLIELTPHLDWLLLTKRPENIHRLWPGKTTNWDNIWYGTSVEDQATADTRIPILLDVAAHIRFVSYEPALEYVNFCAVPDSKTRPQEFSAKYTPLGDIDWVIVGGESGAKARPFNVEWARSTIRLCREAGASCFIKQLGAHPYTTSPNEDDHSDLVSIMDHKGGDPDEWPDDLRVREFPR